MTIARKVTQKKNGQVSRSSRRRKKLSFESLEARRVLATITFQSASGGSWQDPTKWDLQRIPAAGDDVVIPAFVGNPVVTFNSGTASVKSLTSSETVRVVGGSLTATQISQLEQTLEVNGGSVSGTLTSGSIAVQSTGSSFGNLTIGVGASLTLQSNAQVQLLFGSTLTINGTATFGTSSSLTMETRNFTSTTTQLIVNGTLTMNASTINKLSLNSPASMLIKSGGRMVATDSTYALTELAWESGAIIGATDLQGNRFDNEIIVPSNLVQSLSQATGGSNNRRFNLVKVRGGVFNSGSLILSAIGTETTQNLSFQLSDDLQIANGSSLIVRPNVRASLAFSKTLTVNGSFTLENASTFTIETINFNSTVTQVSVFGTFTSTNATINKSTGTSPANVQIKSGGRMIATDSTFTFNELSWEAGAIINTTDLQGNRFDTPLFIPANLVGRLAATTGGSNNRRFGLIKVGGGVFNSGDLILASIGTETTQNLTFQILEDLQIVGSSSLIVRANVPVSLAFSKTLTVAGSATLEANSVFTIETINFNSTPTQVVVSGTWTATSATMTKLTGTSPANMLIKSGGRLVSSNSAFTFNELAWESGALLNTPDLQGNRFDTPLLVPANLVGRLSAQHGGSDNRRFNLIKVRGGSLLSGNLPLSPIGTETTQNLSYQFPEDLQIGSAATLTIDNNVPVSLAFSRTLTIAGTANLGAGSRLTIETNNFTSTTTQLVVSGTLNTTGATILKGTGTSPARLVVSGGARLNALNSSFPGLLQEHALNSNIAFSSSSGGATDFGIGGIATTLTEIDTLEITQNSSLTVSQSVRVASSSLFNVSDSSIYSTTGSLLVEPSTPLSFIPSGTFRFVGSGTTGTPQLLEAVSADLGLTAAGFSAGNYLFGTIEIGAATFVRLIDQADNSSGANEAIYTNSLIVRAGATLDLSGLRMYTRAVFIENGGSIINGDVQPIFSDGGPLTLGQPTPGKIAAVGQVDEWTFFARAGGSVAITLNPGTATQPAAIAPLLNFGRATLVDPAGNTITFADSLSSGAVASISSTVLPSEGIYKLRVSAPTSNPLASGNYVITATDTTPNPRSTAIVIQSSRTSTMMYGESVTFTATVKPLAATVPNATGTVQFKINGNNFGAPVSLNAQTASITVPLLNAGDHIITVDYTDNTNTYDAKTSAGFTQVVNKVVLQFKAEGKTKRAGEPIPQLTYFVNGFVNNENASVLAGQPSLSAPAQSVNQAGTYSISIAAGTLVATNYAFQFTGSLLQVSPADPAVLITLSGTPQSTKAGRVFASAMQVRVTDEFGNRISNAQVTFTAPLTGASGTFSNNDRTLVVATNAIGDAGTANFLSNETVGSFGVTATIGALTTSFQLTNLEQGPPLELFFSSDSLVETGGTVTATLRRNTPLGLPLTAALASSNSQLIQLPLSVTFASNADSVQFNVVGIDNTLAAGNASIDISATTLANSVTKPMLVIDDEEAKLNLLFSPLTIPEDGGIAIATISRNTPTTGDLVVNLTSPDAAHFTFPATVTIPAGSASTTFQVIGIDDGLVTGTRVVSLHAAATNLLPSTRTLELFDDDTPEIVLSIAPNSVAESGQPVVATLRRNTSTAGALLVTLTSDASSKIQLPPNVVIPAGDFEISFPISIVNDAIASINATVNVTASAANFPSATASFTIVDDESPTLTLTGGGFSVIEGGSPGQLQVRRNTPTTSALAVTLSVDKPGHLSFPVQVVIPAGESTTSFTVVANDDDTVDGDQLVTITASANGLSLSTANVTVVDRLAMTLQFDVGAISEKNGFTRATITRPAGSIAQALDVQLSYSPSGLVSAPVTVTIPAGETVHSFTLAAIDNDLLDGPRTVQVTASANGCKAVSTNLQIIDVESLALLLDIASISENGGTSTGILRRSNSNTSQPLVVTLINSNESMLSVPATVTIPANQSQVSFTIAAIDNQLLDGLRSVSFAASANGYETSSTSVQIIDSEQLLLTLDLATISEAGGVAVGTVRRQNTDNASSIVITLGGASGVVNIPATVTIPAGSAQTTFNIAAIDNQLLDGTRTAQIVAGAAGYQSTSTILQVTDAEMLQLSFDVSSISESAGVAVGTVRRTNTDTGSQVVVSLSGAGNQLNIPSTVTIPAGSSQATFTINAIDNQLLDGTRSVQIAANASGYENASANLQITDLEQLLLTLDVSTISELNGVATATVRRTNTNTASSLVVNIGGNGGSQANLPATVTIPAGSSQATFNFSATDNQLLDGSRTIQITANASGYEGGTASLQITDSEQLVVSFDQSTISESGGTAVGTVRRPNTDNSAELIVNLSSNDASEITVPVSVTIPAGASSATFSVTAANDDLLDRTQNPSVTASASGYVSGSASIAVTDHETLAVSILPQSISERNATATVTITRSDLGSLGAVSVVLTSNRPNDIRFTSPIVIPAGQPSVSFSISTVDNTVVDFARNVQFTATATDYVLGTAILEITDDDTAKPWHNAARPLDVNNDTRINANDALIVINYIKRNGSVQLSLPYTGDFVDTDGNDRVSAIDALLVINELKRRAASAEGEGLAVDSLNQATFANVDGHEDVLSPSFLEDIAEARRKRGLQ